MVQAQEKILRPRSHNSLLMFRLGLRWVAIGIGALLFFWLPVEDVELNAVLGYSGLIALWGGSYYLVSQTSNLNLKMFAWAGVLAGLAVGPLGVFLIILKGGLHAHGYLDFSLGQIMGILSLMPLWGFGGLISGIFAGIIYRRNQA